MAVPARRVCTMLDAQPPYRHVLRYFYFSFSRSERTTIGGWTMSPYPIALLLASSAAGLTIRSGSLTVQLNATGGAYTLKVAGQAPSRGTPLSVFAAGATRTIANGGLVCADKVTSDSGTDEYGKFDAAEVACNVTNGSIPVRFRWRAYAAPKWAADRGMLVATAIFPAGATGTAVAKSSGGSPEQFAPFPSFVIEGGLANAAYLCYGGDKAHMYSAYQADGGLASASVNPSCFGLGNGPGTLLWGGGGGGAGMSAMVAGPASAFHLNYNRRSEAQPPPPPDPELCVPKTGTDYQCCEYRQEPSVGSTSACCALCQADAQCSAWKIDSKDPLGTCYLKKGELSNPVPSPTAVVGRRSACNATIIMGHDYVGGDISSVDGVQSAAECCVLCQANPSCSHFKIALNGGSGTCYLKSGPLINPVVCPKCAVGIVRNGTTSGAGCGTSASTSTWSFGLSGEVDEVPQGFEQSTLIVHSPQGPNAAWDNWGGAIRAAYNTTKRADEDVFQAALTIWTDNGAATLGPAWKSAAGVQPPAYTKLGPDVSFMNWNWSRVDTKVLGQVADSVRETGVAPRGTQLDCWWYPVQTGGPKPASQHPFWCVSDWILPEEFYPNGTGGVRSRMGTPLMLYFPVLCVENAWNAAGKYTWSPGTPGFSIPVANQSEMFWSDMFDYGAALAAKSSPPGAHPWPGAWAPPAVVEGWRGTNLAAYETDFYHNIVSETPELRTVYGAGEMFLQGIHDAAAARNMTVQLCAGNPPSFLEALTMPSVTQARASIDYDWDGKPKGNTGPRSNNGNHNWAGPDNGWVFWATRIAPSKDNFWTSFRDLFADGGSQDSSRNGKDAELHAIAAVLTTGPVGLGDTCVTTDTGAVECMANATLIRRLARADGVLLRPDRPLAPADVMFGSLLGDSAGRAMPGLCTLKQEKQPAAESADCGARLWQTHATVYPEDVSRAPELAVVATRRLVSHAGVDATDQRSVPEALAASPGHLLQHLIVSVDQPSSFALTLDDLYPMPASNSTVVFVREATDGGPSCTPGVDAVESGCVGAVVASGPSTALFDVSTAHHQCSQPNYTAVDHVLPLGSNCLHTVGVWQLWTADSSADFVLLGDLTAYVSLSGYRFRLPQGAASAVGEQLVVVGMPGETVAVTYLRRKSGAPRDSATDGWTVFVEKVVVGTDGRATMTLP